MDLINLSDEDIRDLDYLLEVLSERTVVTQNDLECYYEKNQCGSAYKDRHSLENRFESLMPFFSEYCGQVEPFSPSSWVNKVVRDYRTVRFKEDGGFKAERDRQIIKKKEEEDARKNELLKIQLEIENLKKNNRFIVPAFIVSVLGFVLSIVSLFRSRV